MKDLLKQLRETQEFQAIMDEMAKKRPIVPAFAPGASVDESNRIIEQIKYQSGMRAGFDLLFISLTGRSVS